MSLVAERSLVVEYWQFFMPILLSLAAIFYYKSRFSDEKIKNPTIEKTQKQQLDGSEYVGEMNFEGVNDDDEFSPALEEKEHVPFPGAKVTLDSSGRKFFEITNDRRSVRKYTQRPVPFEVIEMCIKAAGTAPSGAHTEPWTFCIVGDSEIKAQIREIIEAEEYLNYSQRMSRQWTTDLKPLQTHYVKEYLTQAPYLILIFKQTYGLRPDGKRKQHYYNEISVSIATGILLCALQAAGLNSLITTPLNCGPALRSLLNRPQNEKLLVLLPVGYAADDCKVPNLQRKDVSEILVRY